MLSPTARKVLTVGGILIAIPIICGLLAYGVVRHKIIAKYDSCISSLADDQRRVRGLELIIEDLRRLDSFKTVNWNVNKPYGRGSLNILIPKEASDAWHAQCGLPMSPPDCLAATHGSFIICNALVGKQLSHPLLVSGIASEEVELARRFLALTILSHEIGHLRSGTSGRLQHLFPTRKANGLRCNKRNTARQTEEERADAYGIATACDAIRAEPGRTFERNVQAAINTISAMRNTLDEDLFAFDDSCAGDDTYPSMSRRKSTFAFAYARCLYPDADLPYDSVATDLDRAFAYMEEWLRRRQITGFVASPEYGASPLYRFDVTGTTSARRFAAFDSSGRSSRISISTIVDDQVRHEVIATWDRAGTLIASHSDEPASVEFLARFVSSDDSRVARHVTVRCNTAGHCDANVIDKNMPAGVNLWPLDSGAIAATSLRQISSYASISDYINGNVAVAAHAEFDLDEDSAVIGGEAGLLLIGRRPSATEPDSGFHLIGIATPFQSRWVTFTTVGTTMSPLRAVGLMGTQAAFLFQSSSAASDQQAELLLCPTAALQAATTTRLECELYRAPDDLRLPIGLANNDLQSLGTSVLRFKYCSNLLAVRQAGWLWLLNPAKQLTDTVPGNGLISCSPNHSSAIVYRARRIDEVRLALAKSEPRKISIAIASSRPGR